MDVGVKPTGEYEGYRNIGFQGKAERVALPEIRVGDVSLYNVPALSYGSGSKRRVPQLDDLIQIDSGQPVMMTVPFLGADTLFPFVYEIDTKKRTLILRDANRFAVVDSPHTKGKVLPLEFANARYIKGVEVFGGCPVVRGEIAGVPATFLIDTGSSSSDIVVTKHLFDKLQRKTRAPQRKFEKTTAYGEAALSGRFNWSMGSVQYGNCLVIGLLRLPHNVFGVVSRTGEDVDAIIGRQLLDRCKVTIDSTHRKILLVPHQ